MPAAVQTVPEKYADSAGRIVMWVEQFTIGVKTKGHR